MGSGPTDLYRHVQQLFGSGCLGGLSDAELLDRYTAGRDEHAFEALVMRHGALVLRVCQGVLRDRHAAEDAFQATFLVLAHKAQSLQVGINLSGWLYGVALRVAKKLRSQNERRDRRERKAAVDPTWGPSVDLEQADVAAVLHEEVDRLPESYRIPTILCYWQGLSYKLAARRLGVSEETIRGRLARSRDRLRIRLTRRGVIVPAGLLAAGESWTSGTATATAATVPSALVDSVVHALRATAGASGVGSASVIALTQGVLRMMFLTQLRTGATALVLTIGGLAAAATLLPDRNVKASVSGVPAPPAGAKEDSPTIFVPPPGPHEDEPEPREAEDGAGNGADEPALGPGVDAQAKPKPWETEPREAEDGAGNGADEPAPGPVVDAQAKPKPWETVVRVKVQGESSIGFGSGTVIQSTREESLILTCAHHFKVDKGPQPSPRHFPHKVTVDLFDGVLDKRQAQVKYVETHSAEVVDFDLQTDVGLLRIRPGKLLKASFLVPPSWKPKAKMQMLTAGCSEGNDATIWSTQISRPSVRLFDNSPYQGIQCSFAPKPGRTGGGLFTFEGDLAGVCNFAEPQINCGYYASPESIYQLLMRNHQPSLLTGDADAMENAIDENGAAILSRSLAPVPSEASLDPLIQAAEQDLRSGNREGVHMATDRLNEQIRIRRDALQSQIQHLDALTRRSDTLRKAADEIPPRESKGVKGSGRWRTLPEPTLPQPATFPTPRSRATDLESTPTPIDQERRLRALERALERLLEERNETHRSAH